MRFVYTPFVIPLLASSALSAGLAIYTWRRRQRIGGGSALSLTMLAVAEWCLCYALQLLSADPESKLFWTKMEYFGLGFVCPLWLIFALQYTGRRRLLSRRNLALLLSPAVFSILAVWSNDWHRLWWPDWRLELSGPFLALALDHGPAFWLHVMVAYTYVLTSVALDHGPAFWLHVMVAYTYVLTSVVLYLLAFWRAPRLFRWQASLMIIGALIPLLGSLVYVSGAVPGLGKLDFAPFGFAISGLLLAYAVFHHRLLEVVPVARQVVVERVLDGMIVVDAAGRILDISPAAREILGVAQPDPVGQRLRDVLLPVQREGLEPILSADLDQVLEGELRYPLAQEERIVTVTASPVEDERGHLLGRLLVFRDVTEQRRAEEAVRRRAQELSALHAVASAVSRSLDLHEVLPQAVDQALAALDADRGAIFLLDRKTDTLSCAYARGLSEAYIAFINAHYRQVPGSRLLQSPEPVHITDAQTDPATAAMREMVIKEGYHTYLVLPLMRQEETIGALVLYRNQVRPFSAEAVDLGQTIAHQLSAAIENARLYRTEQARRRIADTLQEVSRIIGSTLELDEVLRLILEQLEKVLDFQAAVLLLVDEARNELYVREWKGYPEDAEKLRLPLSGEKGITVHVARTGQPIYVPDVTQEERYISGGFKGGSELAAPLKVKDKVIGVLNVESEERNAFDEEDLHLLVAFANQAAIAIENARLYEESQERLRELAILMESGATLVSTFDLAESLDKVAKLMVRTIGVEACAISSWEKEEGAVSTLAEHGSTVRIIKGGTTYRLEDYPATAQLLHSGQPFQVRVDDPAADEKERALLEEWAVKSLLALPIARGNGIIGLVELYDSERTRTFSPEEIVRGQAWAEQMAPLVEKLSTLRGEEEEEEEKLITALRRLAVRAMRDLGLHWCTISRWDQAEGQVVTLAEYGSMSWPRREGASYSLTDYPATARMLHQRQPLLVRLDDSTADERERAKLKEWGWGAMLCLPMVVRDEVIGMVELFDRRPRSFTASEIELCQTLANQAAMVIENARLYEQSKAQVAELQRATNELRNLQAISQAMTTSLDPFTILQAVAEGVVTRLGYNASLITLYSAEEKCLTMAAAYPSDGVLEQVEKLLGIRAEPIRVPIDPAENPGYERVLRGEPWLSHRFYDFVKPKIGEAEADALQRLYGTRSFICVPLWTRGRMVGSILAATRREEISRRDQETLQAVARQAAIAIENAQLYEQTRKHLDQLSTLYEVSKEIASTLDLDAVLQSIVTQAVGVTGAERSFIWLVDAAKRKVTKVVGHGYDREYLESLTFEEFWDGLGGWVFREKVPTLTADTINDERVGELARTKSRQLNTKSVALAPLLTKGEVTGVLVIANSAAGRVFDQTDLDLVAMLASQAAIAIENARLFEETKRLKAFNESIVQGVAEAILIEDAQGILTFANPAAEELLGYSREELIGLHWSALIPEDQLEKVREETAKRPLGIESRYEAALLSKEGQVIPVIVSARPLFENGQFVGVLAAFTDISERKRMEEALRESEERYRAIVEDQTELLCRCLPDGRLTFVNEAYCRYFGKKREELVGHSCMRLIFEEDREKVREQFASLSPENPLVTYEQRVILPSGEIRWQQWTDRAIFDEQGSFVEVQSVGRDITERVRGEEMLHALNAAAAAIQRAARTPEAVFTTVMERLQALGLTGAIVLLDEERKQFTICYAMVASQALARAEQLVGLKAVGYTFPVDQFPIGQRILAGEAVFVPDVAALLAPVVPAPGRPLMARAMRLLKMPRGVVAPLSIKGEIIGFLGVSADHMTEADIPAVTAFANQMAAALENAELYETMERRWREAETLRQVGAAITETLSLDETLERILEQLERVLPYDSASVQLLRDGHLEIVSGRGFRDPEAVIGLKFPVPGDNPNAVVIEKRQPVILADAQAAYSAFREPPHNHIRSWLGVPLIIRDQVIGMLAVDSVELGHFNEEHVRLITPFANQVAVAIENARLFDETRARAESLSALYEISKEINASLELDRVLDVICDEAMKATGAAVADVALVDLEQGIWEMRAVRGFTEDWKGRKYSLDVGIHGRVVRTGEPAIIPDVREAEDYLFADPRFRSELAVPILLEGKVVGVINLESTEPSAFDEDDLRFVQALADQAAIALRNAHLFEKEERRVAQLRAISEVGKDIASVLNLDELLHRVVNLLVDVFSYYYANILMVDEEAQEIVLTASAGQTSRASEGLRLKIGERGITGWVAGSGEPLLVNDVDKEPRYHFVEELADTKSELAVPITLKGEVIGVLDVQSNRLNAFDEMDLSTLTTLADQLAVAIENARLYEAEQKRWQAADTLRQVATVLSSTLDLKQVLDLILEHLARVVPYDSASVMLVSDGVLRVVAARGFPDIARTMQVTIPVAEDALFQEMLRTKRPVILTDAQKDERFLAAGATTYVHGWIGAPLVVKGQVIGTLTVDSREPGAYGQEEAEMVAAFANQAAIAIENARLHEETRRRLAREERLNELAHALGGEMELATIIPRLLPLMVELTGADAGTVAILDPERQVIIYPYHHNLPDSLAGIEVPAGTGLAGHIMAVRQPVLLDDYREHPAALQAWVVAGVRSVLGVPLLAGEEVVGALGLFSLGEVRPFGPEAVAVAEAASRLAAVAIQRARLYEETRQRATELGILYEVATTAMTSLRLDEILNRTMAALRETLQADCIAILLLEPETNELVIRASIGFPDGPKLVRRPIGVGIPGWVVQTGQPVLLADVRQDERYHACDPDTRSELCVPLRVGERIIGALNLESRRLAAFSEDDLRLLSILAGHLAAVIENARLVEGLEAEVAARTAEIRAEQEKSETILRSVGDAIAMTDLQMRIRYVNAAFTNLTGYTAEEVLGQSMNLLFGEAMPEQVWRSLQLALSKGEAWQGEVIARRKDGRTYDAAITIAPMRDAEGNLIGYVSSHRDISQLKELDRARSRFMTNVSHELRTPVANMQLYAQLLRKGLWPEKTEHYLQVLEEQAVRLSHLIQDILEITALDSGQAATTWEPVRLASLIGDTVTRYQARAEASGLTLVAKPVPPDLPVVKGDQVRLTQALAELVENAIQFTPAGGEVTIEAETAEEEGQRWVTIAVRDTGPGISAEEQERIFDRFYRGRLAESGHIPGTGLGLSIVQEIVRAHGGRVTVESEVGQGSTFTLWLRAEEQK